MAEGRWRMSEKLREHDRFGSLVGNDLVQPTAGLISRGSLSDIRHPPSAIRHPPSAFLFPWCRFFTELARPIMHHDRLRLGAGALEQQELPVRTDVPVRMR